MSSRIINKNKRKCSRKEHFKRQVQKPIIDKKLTCRNQLKKAKGERQTELVWTPKTQQKRDGMIHS